MWINCSNTWINLDYVCMIDDTERIRVDGAEKEPALVLKLAHGSQPLDFVLFGSQREKAMDVLNKHDIKKLRSDSKSDLRIVSI